MIQEVLPPYLQKLIIFCYIDVPEWILKMYPILQVFHDFPVQSVPAPNHASISNGTFLVFVNYHFGNVRYCMVSLY